MALLHVNGHIAFLPVYLKIKLVQRTARIREERKKFLKIKQLSSLPCTQYALLKYIFFHQRNEKLNKILQVIHSEKKFSFMKIKRRMRLGT